MMSYKTGGGPAFPWCGDLNDTPHIGLGMSFRDYFAAKAMQSIIKYNPSNGIDDESINEFMRQVAKYSYVAADAMLKERNK